ncbi:MAG: hypothetical protein DHS20C21_09890 [Gemmatimonadota bacterium]|nr:MAG: hypothetical protein DHS20C21_09890 [Gemmatimonadota bacterium]
MSHGQRPGRRHAYLDLALLGLVVAATFRWTRNLGLLGFDSYAIILTSRIRSWADFVGTFTESLMDGRYPGDFYRPILNLTFAADYAAWGVDPLGYQWTSALLFGLAVVALHRLARTVAPGAVHWVVPFVFVLHPAASYVVPFPARRAETLCCLFLTLAVTSACAPSHRRRWLGPLAVAAFTALAIGSKETGYLAPPLMALAAWIAIPGSSLRERLLEALRRAIPSGLAAVGMLLLRWQILGGLGGHGSSEVATAPERIGEVALKIGERLVVPASEGLSVAWVVLATAAFAGVALLSRRQNAGSRAGAPALAWIALSWLALSCLTYASAGRMTPWYIFIPAAAWSLVVAAMITWLVAGVRSNSRRLVGPSAIGLLGLILLVGYTSQQSLLLRPDQDWIKVTEASSAVLDSLRESLEASTNGEAVDMELAEAQKVEGRFRFGRQLPAYAVQAWCELEMPDRNIRVVALSLRERMVSGTGVQPDEVVVVVPPVRNADGKSPAP